MIATPLATADVPVEDERSGTYHCVRAPTMAQIMPEETSELLTRLSQKPGVQSTLILSRKDGAIVRASGLISGAEAPASESTLPSSPRNQTSSYGNGDKAGSGLISAEEVARMVWSFFGAAGGLVKEMEKEDEVKLLRLRTKRHELVVVPDPKFLLVVIHDTPPA